MSESVSVSASVCRESASVYQQEKRRKTKYGERERERYQVCARARERLDRRVLDSSLCSIEAQASLSRLYIRLHDDARAFARERHKPLMDGGGARSLHLPLLITTIAVVSSLVSIFFSSRRFLFSLLFTYTRALPRANEHAPTHKHTHKSTSSGSWHSSRAAAAATAAAAAAAAP